MSNDTVTVIFNTHAAHDYYLQNEVTILWHLLIVALVFGTCYCCLLCSLFVRLHTLNTRSTPGALSPRRVAEIRGTQSSRERRALLNDANV